MQKDMCGIYINIYIYIYAKRPLCDLLEVLQRYTQMTLTHTFKCQDTFLCLASMVSLSTFHHLDSNTQGNVFCQDCQDSVHQQKMHIIETIAHCNLHCQSKHRSNITKDSSFSVACFSHIAHGVRLFEITCCQPLQQLIYLRHLDCVIQGRSCVLLECLSSCRQQHLNEIQFMNGKCSLSKRSQAFNSYRGQLLLHPLRTHILKNCC